MGDASSCSSACKGQSTVLSQSRFIGRNLNQCMGPQGWRAVLEEVTQVGRSDIWDQRFGKHQAPPQLHSLASCCK